MRIQHNIAALNSHRQLTGNNSAVSKNLEKLSSGYRINRAGDDAAGLAISEKMRAQITGLNTASKNAQDGISLVQTAEGALTEVHSMLNRMTELADQAANGTYQDLVDRENIQKEMDSLRGEIDRISQGTNFNGIKLLDGSMGGAQVSNTAGVAGAVTPATSATISFDVDKLIGAGGIADTKSLTIGDLTVAGTTDTDGSAVKSMDALKAALTAAGNKVTIGGKAFDVALNADGKTLDLTAAAADIGETGLTAAGIAGALKNDTTAAVAGDVTFADGADAVTGAATPAETTLSYNGNPKVGDTLEVGSGKYQFIKTAGDTVAAGYTGIVIGADTKGTVTNINAALGTNADVANATVSANGTSITFESALADPTKAVTINQKSQGLTLQIGDTADSFNQLSVAVKSMSSESLGIGKADISVANQDDAKSAMEKIKTAINTVSSTRGDLGAIQNRLEHTINNLGVTAENMTAAESRIRDVDMAQEMMAFTKNNILTQASQSMLAQANQLPQGVLQLLQ